MIEKCPENTIKSEIYNFLESDDLRILNLDTVCKSDRSKILKKCIGGAVKARSIRYKNYSYVSLFGLRSIADLKREVYINLKRKTLIRGILSLLIREYFAIRIPILDYTDSLIMSSLFYQIRDVVVCVDDIETISRGLDSKELLRTLSYLAKYNNCKLVFVFSKNAVG